PDLVPALKDQGDGATGRGGALELRDLLVIAQVAVSVVLLVGGALMARSVGAASDIDLGYDARRTAYFGLAMDMNGYDGEESEVFFQAVQERLEVMPEVEGVTNVSRVPLSLNNNGFGLFIDGHQASVDDTPYRMDGAHVDEAYFDVLGLELVAGRGFETADRDDNLRVAVVTVAMARRYWPGQDGIGQSFRTSWEGEPWQIVGVVEDYRVDTPGEAPKDYIHLPLRRNSGYGNLLVRTRTDAAALVPALERQFRTLDPDFVFVETGTLWTLAEVRLFPVRAGAWLIGAFGLLAVLLAAVGLYGVIGYSVSRRVREIGIRRALGAQTNQVVGAVVAKGLVLVGGGAVVGLVLAALAARALTSALYVPALDPVSFGLALVVLALVGVLAHWIPARRAAGVDPTEALRRG
ncbi:MAG: FtsX-like permease family protein, partial [Longimicrobiales bacterium]